MASARARSAPLAGECAGYLVLAAADHAAQGPRRIEAGSVELHSDGSVRVVGGSPSDEAATERDLRELLDELLLVAGSVTPALLRSARRRTGVGIDGFVREIETALIPVNRAAARRALSRLERETSRAIERGGLVVENQRVSDRALAPEPRVAAAPPLPPVVSETPPPASLTPPPATQPPVSALPPSRPATDLLPTPVAVPVRPRITLEPILDETPSKLETRPETVLARASQRPPVPPSSRPEGAKSEPRLLSPAPVAVAPCAPPPAESMTPFLGTATAQRPPAATLPGLTATVARSATVAASPAPRAPLVPAVSAAEEELDVPIEVEVPLEAAPLDVDVPLEAARLDEIAEDSIVEEAPGDLTEPFYPERESSDDVGLAFHELTALTGGVAPVIELAESPAPAVQAVSEPDDAEDAITPPPPPVVEQAAAVAEVVMTEASAAVEEVAADEVVVVADELVVAADAVASDAEVAASKEEVASDVEVVASSGELASDVEVVASNEEVAPDVQVAASSGELASDVEVVASNEEVASHVEVVAVDEVAEPSVVVEASVAIEPVPPPRGEFDDVELAVLLPSAEPPPVMMRRPTSDPASLLPRRPLPPKRSSNVDELLSSFGHPASDAGDEEDVRSTLKRLAGLDPTPSPPGASRD